jgi:hypothetical protein
MVILKGIPDPNLTDRKLPSNQNCETAINGIPVDGVESITCPKNPASGDMVYKCTKYSGQLTVSKAVDNERYSGEGNIVIIINETKISSHRFNTRIYDFFVYI